MLDQFVAAHLALRAARQEIDSARPDAPVVPARGPRRPRRIGATARSRAAAYLHRVASALEPAQQPDRRLAPRTGPSAACR